MKDLQKYWVTIAQDHFKKLSECYTEQLCLCVFFRVRTCAGLTQWLSTMSRRKHFVGTSF